MNWIFGRKKFLFFIVIGLIISLVMAGVGLLFSGNRWAINHLLDLVIPESDVQVREIDGNLLKGTTFRNIVINNLLDMPQGTELKIQEVTVNGSLLNWKSVDWEIHNARLFLPNQDPVVLNGRYINQEFDINIFTNGALLSTLVDFWPDWNIRLPKPVSLDAIDLYVRGTVEEPIITGQLVVSRAVFNKFELTGGAPLTLDLRINQRQQDWKLYGVIHIAEGVLICPHSVLKLSSSHLSFDGNWANPRFDLRALTVIDRVRINLDVQGDLEKPELNLVSDPVFSREELMLMVATGKRWKGVNNLIGTGAVTGDLTKDFIDYIFLAGRGQRFANRYGVYDVSVTLERNRYGISARKSLFEWLDVGYAVEKEADQAARRSQVQQKVDGALKLTDKLSVGVERQMETQFFDQQQTDPTEVKDNYFMRFKTKF